MMGDGHGWSRVRSSSSSAQAQRGPAKEIRGVQFDGQTIAKRSGRKTEKMRSQISALRYGTCIDDVILYSFIRSTCTMRSLLPVLESWEAIFSSLPIHCLLLISFHFLFLWHFIRRQIGDKHVPCAVSYGKRYLAIHQYTLRRNATGMEYGNLTCLHLHSISPIR